MLDNNSWDRIAGKVSESDFYRPDHQLIFVAIGELAEKDHPRDAVTLSEHLGNRGQLVDAGGLGYLGTLVKDTPSAANSASYAEIVRERALLRDLISVGNDIAASAYQPEGRPAKELVELAEKHVFEIAEKGAHSQRDFVPLKELCSPMVDLLDKRHQAGESVTGLSTGFKKFDEIT